MNAIMCDAAASQRLAPRNSNRGLISMSSSASNSSSLSGPFVMFLSAAIFAYFGFYQSFSPINSAGAVVPMWAILLWTLRIGAIAFAVSGVLTILTPLAGNALYALASLLTAIGLLTVGVMDLADAQYGAPIPPLLAFIFAAWNGYGAWTSLGEIMGARRAAA
jgi:hypothetical protein